MFDARAARALKPGEHITVEEAPGLRLVATKTRLTWTYRYRPEVGVLRQVSLGLWPAMGFPAALAAWQRVRERRAAGVDPAQAKKAARREAQSTSDSQEYTVARACAEYLRAYEAMVAPRTFSEAKRLLDRDAASIAEKAATSVTRADAFKLIDGMRDRPVVASSLRRLLGAVWDRSIDSGRLPPETPNWWRLILRGKLPSQGKAVKGKRLGVEKRVLNAGELGLLLPWLPNFTRDIEDALVLYLWTCCRGAEIVAMERGEVADEVDGLWWTIPRTKLKMRRNPALTDLRIPLVGRAEAVVRRRLAATDKSFLFTSRGRSQHIEQKAVGVAIYCHMPGCALRPEWQRPRLPVTGWAPHDLRRTGRTMLASLGCPTDVAEAILGHLPPGIQNVYNRHSYDSERRVWLTRLDAALEELARRVG